MKKENTPNYSKIYYDLLKLKFPEKIEKCKHLLKKDRLNVLDVIELNQLIFENSNINQLEDNQKLKAYTKEDVLFILDYQKKNHLNNTQLVQRFKLSRNTITKWKKIFLV